MEHYPHESATIYLTSSMERQVSHNKPVRSSVKKDCLSVQNHPQVRGPFDTSAKLKLKCKCRVGPHLTLKRNETSHDFLGLQIDIRWRTFPVQFHMCVLLDFSFSSLQGFFVYISRRVGLALVYYSQSPLKS